VIGALDDFSFEIGEDFRQGLLEFRSLIAAVPKLEPVLAKPFTQIFLGAVSGA
jgi:hypothetical protein